MNHIDKFKQLIELIKTKICIPITERPMTLGEKNALALHDPDKFNKEIKQSSDNINNLLDKLEDQDLANKWKALIEDLLNVSKDTFNYISKNITK